MEILHNFGFNTQLFVAQIINFLILAYLFKRFMYKPMLKLIKKREDTIKKGLDDAEAAELALAKAEEEREKIIAKASTEAKMILSETKTSAESMREEIISKSRGEADKIIADAKTQAQLEIERIKGEGERIAVSITASLLEKTLGKSLDPEQQQQVIKRTIQSIKKYEN